MASPLNSGFPDRIARLAQEREFHKYYLFGPTGPDLGDRSTAPTFDKHGNTIARCSPDTALTAFAQLGALRLDARRAMISLFDRSHQHILAEATRTLSLQTGLPDTDDDSLWFGTKSLPREYGICTHVMDLLPRLPIGNGDIPRESTLMVPDVKRDVRFQNAGMVVDYPDTRFFAGVPIVSPKGIVIGTFSVMDDRPRDALNPALIAFMAAISKTVMNHLSLAKSREASHRGELMIDGIGSFIEGKATLRGAAREARLARIAIYPEDDTAEGHLDSQQQTLLDTAIRNEDQAYEDRDTMTGDFPRPANQGRPIERLLHEKSTEKVKMSENGPADSKPESEPSSNEINSSGATGPFSRASNIIRESMQVEGVAFFDATLKSYGGPPQNSHTESSDTENLSTSRSCSSEDCSDSSVSPPDTTEASPESTIDSDGVAACEILGFSTTVGSSINHDLSGAGNFALPEKLLRALLRRYPQGKIFNFDESGFISSGDTSDGGSHKFSKLLEQQQGDVDTTLRTSRKKNTREARRRAEASDIVQIFTGARSIVFLPLWDSRRSRWFSGIIAWTRMPQRIFNVAPDLLFLQAFGNNLMAEIHRLDIETANNQHATLISSISHELRSPLHGILGSSELLRDAPLNLMQRDMIQTMESCGQTLLDIINHLLDFAKINQSSINKSTRNLTVQRKHGSKSKKQSTSALKRNQSIKKISGTVRPSASTPQVDLGVITEEVVDAVYAGHCFQRMPKFQFHTLDTVRSAKDRVSSNHIANTGECNNVAIILDIDQSVNWNMKMEPGAWRRILMNIFGNALKHTNTGFIHVKLGYSVVPAKRGKREQKSSRGKSQEDTRSCICLNVRDTGRGISQEYLHNHLYTPFSQENPLLPGNGLGLSIVQHTVQSLGGSIDIQSAGETGCDVSVQIDADPPSPRINLKSPFCAQAQDSSHSKSLGLIRFNSPADPEHDAPSLVDNSLTTMCQKSLGIEVKTLDLSQEAFEVCDYYFLAQLGSSTLQDLATQMCVVIEKRKQHGCLQNPLIVLCTTPCHAQELLAVAQGIDEGAAMEVISQPCGPRKFLKTLELCAEQSAAHTQISDSASSDRLSSEPLTTPEPDHMIHTMLGPNEDRSYMTLKQKDKEEVREPNILAARPRVVPEEEQQDQVAPVIPETEKPSGGADPEFMIVDDNEINQKLLAAFLKRQNCSYKTADNGLDALVAFQANPGAFKAIFMDITMPVMDGLTATREIRRVEQEHLATLDDTAKSSWRSVAIVAVTGLGSPVIQQDALSAGVDLFLTRPVRFSHLREIVESIGDP